MLFPTLDFAIFFVPVLVLVWTVGQASNEWRKIILLLASWVFYGAWDWRFVLLLIASAAINCCHFWVPVADRHAAFAHVWRHGR